MGRGEGPPLLPGNTLLTLSVADSLRSVQGYASPGEERELLTAPLWDLADPPVAGAQLVVHARQAGGGDFGMPVVSGDLTGDGIDDVVAGAIAADAPSGPSRAGRILLVTGGPLDGPQQEGPSPRVSALYGGDNLGQVGSQLCLGDVNGDGLLDVVVGARGATPFERGGAGEAYILFGGPALQAAFRGPVRALDSVGVVGVEIAGPVSGAGTGVWVACLDHDGDGIDDVAVGSYLWSPDEERVAAGATHLFFGAAEWPELIDLADDATWPVDTRMIQGAERGDHLGVTLAGADMDGDGADELILGSGALRVGVSGGGGDGLDNERPDDGEAWILPSGRGGTRRPCGVDARRRPHLPAPDGPGCGGARRGAGRGRPRWRRDR